MEILLFILIVLITCIYVTDLATVCVSNKIQGTKSEKSQTTTNT